MSERGGVHVYRPAYTKRDKTTGERITRQTSGWAWRFSYRGKRYSGGGAYPSKAEARVAGDKRKAEVVAGQIQDPRRTTYETLEQIILREYSLKGEQAVKRLACHMKWLKTYFGGRLACEITRSDLIGYVQSRRESGAADSTIKLELAYLRRSMRLAQGENRLIAYPRFPTIPTYPKQGYFTREQIEAIIANVPAWWKGAFRAGYITGWRFRSEILTRTWNDVDTDAGLLRLNAGEGKKRRARVFPLEGELAEIIDLQEITVHRLEKQLRKRIPWVFPGPDGDKLKYPYPVWHKACAAAGLVGKLPHDMRRAFARDLNLAQIPAPIGMQATGHTDEKTYKGYAGEDEGLVRWAVEKVQEMRKSRTNVSTFRRKDRIA